MANSIGYTVIYLSFVLCALVVYITYRQDRKVTKHHQKLYGKN